MAQLYFLALLFCIARATHEAGIFHFEVHTSAWSECRQLDYASGCTSSREAVCVRAFDNRTAPWYYCTERGLRRPEITKECSPCLQNCAVSQWSDWSRCDCNSNSYRNRTRDVVSPARNGGEPCPALMETEACACAFAGSFDTQPRIHSWKTGEWGDCQSLNTTSRCGPGLRNREVLCVNLQGQAVAASNCSQEGAYSSIFPPTSQMLCEVSCPCVLGDWGNFSSCKPQCEQRVPAGIRIRTRPILQVPTHGLSCQPTEDTEACSIDIDSCPTYSWSTSTWSSCNLQTGATCGAGHRARYIYCLKMLNDSITTVDHSYCENLASTSKPVGILACSTRCPEACIVGDWSEWTECPISCEQTYSNRTREILLHPFNEVCPHTVELRLCPVLPCARWVAQAFEPCRSLDSSCGAGYHHRRVDCVGPNNERLRDTMCPALKPAASIECHKPCDNECVLSPWSDWTPCSQRCGGIGGNQSRSRQLLANGTSCPENDMNLLEFRNCTIDEECHPPVYSLQFSLWGECVPNGLALTGSGASPTDDPFSDLGTSCSESGLQNRTIVCLKDGRAVQPSECPISYQNVEVQNCERPCLRSCVFSEWSPYSNCSASCGIGMRRRSRRLLQWSSTSSDSCIFDDDGFDYDYDLCISPCTGEDVVKGVAWYSSNWTQCSLYDNSVFQQNCGPGYQSRTVQCVNLENGHFVSELKCTSLDMPRPSTVQNCHVQCTDKCLVSEWSSLSPCTRDGITSRQRSIVPFTGCSDWRLCCPHLTSIQLQQNVSCSDPAQERQYEYIYVEFSFSSCIFDDPSKVCGVGGKKYRQKACVVKFTSNPVDESFCSGITANLEVEEECTVKCERDCVQSDWEPWSQCSSSCGYGLRNRTRSTITEPLESGRKCGPELEIDVCENAPCPVVQIIPGPFSACVPTNTSAICGEGHRTRQPICTIDGVIHELGACHNMNVKNFSFDLVESCNSPCPGECVFSEWGEWSSCSTNCPVGSCQRKRTRELLRQSDPPCSTTEQQQLELCSAPVNPYRWQEGEWLDCIVPFNISASLTPGQYCGQGRQRRILSCMNMSTDRVHEQFCIESGLPKPPSVRNCSVPCPVDCIVGPFSNWSECTGCYFSSQRRERQIVIHPNEEGVQCPELVQERQCAPVGCVNQSLIQHAPLDLLDYTPEGQCGVVLRETSYSCTQNTRYVSPDMCTAATISLTEDYTTLPCPSAPACIYTDWSDLSDCVSLCTAPQHPFQFQYRRFTASTHQSLECERAQLHVEECQAPVVENWNNSGVMNFTMEPTNGPENQCIDFRWVTSEWSEDQREVYCQSLTDIRVNNTACPPFIKPLSVNETCANVSCPPYASCSVSDGRCLHTCQDNFEAIDGQCLPMSGCVEDVHCLIPHTECDTSTGSCNCRKNYRRAEIGDLCVLVETPAVGLTTTTDGNTSSGGRATTMASTGITKEGHDDTTDTSVGTALPGFQLGTLHIVLIAAVPLLLLILLVIILILITCKCSRTLERKQQHRAAVQRRRTKASISSPSPTHQMYEMKRRVTDSNSSGFVDGPDAENYGLPGASFLPDGQADDCVDEPCFSPPRFTGGPPVHPIPVAAPITPGYQGNIQRGMPPGSAVMRQPIPYLYRRPYFSDGAMTDMTCTTDDDETVGTASVAPSSPGSPSTSHKHIPTNIPEDSSRVTEQNTHNELPENPYVSMHRRSPIYARVRGSARSPVSPGSPGKNSWSNRFNKKPLEREAGRRHHFNPGEKDGRIALGLDNSLLRAAHQVDAGHQTPTTPNSTRSMGTYTGKRRSGRRRRSHANRPHPPTTMWYQDPHYHYFKNGQPHYNYRSDGQYSSEQDLNSASDIEYSRNTLPSHGRQHGHHHGYEDHHRHYHHGDKAHYRGDGCPSHSNYYSSREGDSQGGRLSSPSVRSRPPDLSPQHYPTFRHPSREYPSSSMDHISSPEHRLHSREDQHCHVPSTYHHHHPCPDCPPQSHTHHHCCYPDKNYNRYSDHDRHSSDRSRCSPERRYHSPNAMRHSSDWDQGSLERSHSSAHQHQDSHYHYDRQSSATSRDTYRQTSFRQDNPPPEFIPPVPPNTHLAPPTRPADDDTYDYPTRYQPEGVRKLRESEKDDTSPYARPRPLHLMAPSPLEGRVTSPYDYPRIKNAGVSTPSSSSGHATPSSPTKQASISNAAFSNPSYILHQLQHERDPATTTASDNGGDHHVTSQVDSSHENVTSHRSLIANQSSASLGFTPQSMTSTNYRNELELPSLPEANTPPSLQASSTPQSATLQVPHHLTIQITPSQEATSPNASPLLSSRRHPPSPLAFNSTSMSDESPRTSGEID